MSSVEFRDGLEELVGAIEPQVLVSALANTARWPSPEAFRHLPCWFPNTARKQPLFTKAYEQQMTNKGRLKFQGNEEANRTLTAVLGIRSRERPNWTCCHIWGNIDQKFQSNQSSVNDPRYYSSPANMVLLPTPLKALTDSVPQVAMALRYASYRTYGFLPENETVPKPEDAGEWFPKQWVDSKIPGIVPYSEVSAKRAERRVSQLSKQMKTAGSKYPFSQVKTVIAYWREKLPNTLFEKLT